MVATPTKAPYQAQLSDLPIGTHKLRAVAKDSRGSTGSHEITIKVEQAQTPSSLTRQHVYDEQQQLCKVIEPETGSTVMDYDAVGNLAWSAAGLDLPSSTTCDRESARTSGRSVRAGGYDAHNRLGQATLVAFGGNGQFRYRYDVLDNVNSSHLGGVKAHNYWYDAKSRLTNVRDDNGATTMGLTYDVQGNLANRNGQQHAFDYGNRLREVVGIKRYRYDAHGRRVSAVDGSGKRLFSLYGNDGTLLYEQRRDRGNTDYIHLGKRLLATRNDGVVTWQHADALGSPVASTNGSGAVVERKQFEPYGASVGAATDGVGYTGHMMDAGTGLAYMQQRYMDPQLGVFLSADPVTAYQQPVGQFNRYRYANGNPYKFTDPDGRIVETVWDVANVAMGATSAYSNFSQGNVGAGIVDSIGVAIDATATAVPFVPGGAGTAIKAARGLEKAVDGVRTADKLGDAGKMVGDLPKPPTGPGSVPIAQRDPQRRFTESARESKRAEQSGQRATGCGTSIDRSNSAGHHVERHADGGPTTSSNHAEVCLDCHKQLHGRD